MFIPNHYDKTGIDSILANSNLSDLSSYYNKAEVNAIVSNINFSNDHYTTEEVDNEISTML